MLCHSLFENAISRLTILQNYVKSQKYNMKWIGTSLLISVRPGLSGIAVEKRIRWDLIDIKLLQSMARPINKGMTTVFYSKRHPYIPLDVSNGWSKKITTRTKGTKGETRQGWVGGQRKAFWTKVVVQPEIVTNAPSSNVCSLKGSPNTATSELQLSEWAELTVED